MSAKSDRESEALRAGERDSSAWNWQMPPRLRFTPTAWAKLLFLRDRGESEVGGFGLAPSDDLLLVEDVALVQQQCGPASVVFDDDSVADFFDFQVDDGLRPEQFARVWVHTHPGRSPEPSIVDEETFARVFAQSQWAVMFILAKGGQTYAQLRFNVGPGGSLEIPVAVEYGCPFGPSEHQRWEEEYRANVVTAARHPAGLVQASFDPPPSQRAPLDSRLEDPFFVHEDEWVEAWEEYTSTAADAGRTYDDRAR